MPTFVICGDHDGLKLDNSRAARILKDAGNENVIYTDFEGTHESKYENWKLIYD